MPLAAIYSISMRKSVARIVSISILLTVVGPAGVSAQVAFDPNMLISDERFADVGTLGGAEGIQKFLESKGSVLAATSPDFITKLREPADVNLKSRLPDPRPNLGRLRTAAELIYDASTSAGINPQVVLVTLQKEQTLITGTFSNGGLQGALDRALGFGCPDEGGCSDIFLGFYHQLFGNFDSEDTRYIGMPSSLVRSFNFESGGVRVGRGPLIDGRSARRGDTITLENTQGPPNNAPATQSVTLTNFATTALYRYTPHVYNGNFNFHKFFTQWFRYANGTLLQTPSGPIHVIDNGLRRQISNFVISQRGLNAANLITVSAGELGEFSLGDVMPPANGTILKNSVGQTYLMENGERRFISSFVAVQRKLNLAAAVLVPDGEIETYKDGGRALPAEGTLVKSRDNAAVYMIINDEKRLLSAFVFRQRGLKFVDVLTAEPGELDTYPSGSLLTPNDGTLIKAAEEPAVYYVGNGQLQPISYFVFVNRGFKFKDVVAVPLGELSSWTKGKFLPPPTGLLVKAQTQPAVYYIESGVKRPISFGVFVANRFSFKDVVVGTDAEIAAIETGPELRLPERAVVKSADAATVYYLVEGVLRPLTLKAFQNRALRFQDVVTVPAEELAKYQIGAVVEN